MGTMKAVAVVSGADNVKGFIQFIQDAAGTHVKGRISGLSPGLHGFHIHALGDTTNGCNSTGPHFNPLKKDHGSPLDNERHAGDLGNVVAGSDGVADISIIDRQIPLSGQHSILGRAVVVHADPDDLGKGGHELSKTTGNAGARVGCGEFGSSSKQIQCASIAVVQLHRFGRVPTSGMGTVLSLLMNFILMFGRYHWAPVICLEMNVESMYRDIT